MTPVNLAALKAGTVVWTRGTNEYGDQRTGGCVVSTSVDTETGERLVHLLTNSPTTPRQPSLWLQRRDKYEPLGLIARLVRLPVGDIDPHAHDDHRDYRTCWTWAKRALVASTLPPADRLGSRLNSALVDAFVTLRNTAIELERESIA